MISGLRGIIDQKQNDAVLIDCGGVIYRVGTSGTSLAALADVGQSARVHTFLLVREDQLALYGFATEDELRLFETLIGVTGVGPRMGLAILSKFAPDRLLSAIMTEDTDLLATVPGVGKRTAARLVLELRGKLPTLDSAVPAAIAGSGDGEVIEALRALGYNLSEAHGAVSQINRLEGQTVEERIVLALRQLSAG